LWVVNAPTQAFRQSKWVAEAVRIDQGKIQGEVAAPKDGFRAFYAELDFAIDGMPYHLSTQLRIAGKPAPVGK